MPQLLLLTLSLLPWISVSFCGVTTVGEFSVLEGRSLTIPCHYEPQFASYVKYWCRGGMREFCTSLARTDDPSPIDPAQDKVSVYDDPVQLMFTVTMNDLQEEESGWYMCGVEVAGVWVADYVAYTHIKVIHGMSVVNSHVSGEEGGRLTVECLYSARYRESEKKWCRSGDWRSCRLTESDGTYQDSSVAISDDRTGAFTVTLKRLSMGDSGWYWCSAGQQQMAVNVLVTPRPTTTTAMTPTPGPDRAKLPPPRPITKESWHSSGHFFGPLIICTSLMMFGVVAIAARKMWKRHKQDPVRRHVKEMEARLNHEYSMDGGDLRESAVIFRNNNSPDVNLHI